jgi:hypothetical protein
LHSHRFVDNGGGNALFLVLSQSCVCPPVGL